MTPLTCYLKGCKLPYTQGALPFCTLKHKKEYANTYVAKKKEKRAWTVKEMQAALLIMGKEVGDRKRGQGRIFE